jgi:hypothetical protein
MAWALLALISLVLITPVLIVQVRAGLALAARILTARVLTGRASPARIAWTDSPPSFWAPWAWQAWLTPSAHLALASCCWLACLSYCRGLRLTHPALETPSNLEEFYLDLPGYTCYPTESPNMFLPGGV